MPACWTIGTCSFIYIGSHLVLKNKINRTKSRRPYQFSSRVFVTSLRRRKNHKDARYKAWLLFLQRTRLVILLRCIVDSYPCPSLMTTSVHLCCQELTHKVWAVKRSFSGYLIGKLLKCMQIENCYLSSAHFWIDHWKLRVSAQVLRHLLLYDWHRKLSPLPRPIRSKTKTNGDLF